MLIAFDGDAVLFSDEAERVYQEKGLAAFHAHEAHHADLPLAAGPFKGFLESLHQLQTQFDEETCPIRTALVTARSAPAHKRAIQTLRHWGIRLNEAFFLGDTPKTELLKAFNPDIFFDDQHRHCLPASTNTPTARVPGFIT